MSSQDQIARRTASIPPILPLFVIPVVSLLLLLAGFHSVRSTLPIELTVEDLCHLSDPSARPVRLNGFFYAVNLGGTRIGGHSFHYILYQDEESDDQIIVRLGRAPSMIGAKEGLKVDEEMQGTIKPADDQLIARLKQVALAHDIPFGRPTLLLLEGKIPAIPAGTILLMLLVLVFGTVATFTHNRHRQLALEGAATKLARIEPVELEEIGPTESQVIRRADASYKRAIAKSSCRVCSTEVMGFMKVCPVCKLPQTTLYYVSANLPLDHPEQFRTLVMKHLGESEYQASKTLARPHLPIPFAPIQSLKERYRNQESNSVHRLIAKGEPSYLKAQALKEEMETGRDIVTVVSSSDDLASLPRPQTAATASATLSALEFTLEDSTAVSLPFESFYLVVLFGEQSTSDTLTRKTVTPASIQNRRLLMDLYSREQDAAIRIDAATFSFDRLEEARGSSPEASFGKLADWLEKRCSEAVFHTITDSHAGGFSVWRSSYYSVWRALVSRRGADADRGALTLTGYRIVSQIGKGAWGQVYKAVQERVDRTVAIKVLTSQFPTDANFHERFLREARTAASLNHQNIVSVIDCNEERGIRYLVMEFVDGTTLKDVVKERGPLQEEAAVRAVKAVAAALAHAHAHDVVHRDIKPENIFLAKDGTIKVGDWGLAKQYTSEEANLTETGAAMGTPNFISPEQVRAEKVIDTRADIYSLGATFFFLLTGRPPYAAGSVVEIMTRHLKDPPPDVKVFRPEISDRSAEVIKKAMRKKREDRFQTILEMKEALG